MKYLEDNPNRVFVVVNGEKVNVDDVEFLDISEGIFGEDIMKFSYNGKTYESTVYRH